MVQEGQRIRGGSRFPDRCSSTLLLDNLSVTFFHRLIFDTPHLAQFIGRTPKIKVLNEANVFFDSSSVYVSLKEIVDSNSGPEFRILCRQPDWELSALA